MKRSFLSALARAMAGLLLTTSAWAQVVFNVNSTADQLDAITPDGHCDTGNGTCTLRAAVMEANRLNADITIKLGAGTYALTQAPTADDGGGSIKLTTPAIGNPLISIQGAGAATTIIDAKGIDRVLSVASGRRASVSDLSLINGIESTTGKFGGGIDNEGTLTAIRITLSGNQCFGSLGGDGSGGGIYNHGSLVMTRSTLSGNTSVGRGGGISNGPAATAKLTLVTFTSNHAGAFSLGGAIYNEGDMTLDQSTLSGNSADASVGGGIASGVSATLTMTRTTVSGNTSNLGGGIYNYGSLFAINSTISGNSATQDGGGIWNHGTVDIYNTTIAFNEADSDLDSTGTAAGIYNTPGATFNLRNSVVVANAVQVDQAYVDCYGALNATGINKVSDSLFSDLSHCSITQYDFGTHDPLNSLDDLGALGNNGGPTQTIPLIPPSFMIDGTGPNLPPPGPPSFDCVDQNGKTLTTDQRGRVRVGASCDIGAFEYGSAIADEIFADAFE